MENKTYFSIEIYDNITITGENPDAVREYLYDMHSGFFQLADYCHNKGLTTTFEIMKDKMDMIGKAIDTVNNHLTIEQK